MFVQLIRGRLAADEDSILNALQQWEADVRPGADGFLGCTAGVTRDGQFVIVMRFAESEAARRNSDREEQARWWAGIEQAIAGPVAFYESTDVDVSMGGGSDDAGFVQILLGRGERQRAREVLEQAEPVLRSERPDIIGGITAWADDGRFVDVAYFRSEAEARAGETRHLSEEGRALFEELAVVMPVDEYVDLPAPRFL